MVFLGPSNSRTHVVEANQVLQPSVDVIWCVWRFFRGHVGFLLEFGHVFLCGVFLREASYAEGYSTRLTLDTASLRQEKP